MIKKILKKFKWFYTTWRKLNRPIAESIGKHITANTITIVRTFGAPIVILLLYFGWHKLAFVSFVVASLGDSLDGMVATARLNMGYKDDPKLGAFLDAFCDKIFWIILSVGILPMANYHNLPPLVADVFLGIIIIILILETALAIVRVADYQFEKENYSMTPRRKLKATMSGKFKFSLEIIGLGGLVLSFPDFEYWAFYTSFLSLIITIPFAIRSLKQKLQARKPTF